MANVVPEDPRGVVDRIALKTLAKREAEYADEVGRLIDAALAVMRKRGTTSRPRVSDIVAAAGLSNDAFYRHFHSKDALVTAILEDGAERLESYLAHQMAEESTPEGQVRRWVGGVLAQASEEMAESTLAVLWNGGSVEDGSGRHFATRPLGALLHEPLAALGSRDPVFDASLAAHATLGKLSEYLWRRATPTRADVDHIAEFCLAAVTGRDAKRARLVGPT
jgi:AcrR family transcriptional regulator